MKKIILLSFISLSLISCRKLINYDVYKCDIYYTDKNNTGNMPERKGLLGSYKFAFQSHPEITTIQQAEDYSMTYNGVKIADSAHCEVGKAKLNEITE